MIRAALFALLLSPLAGFAQQQESLANWLYYREIDSPPGVNLPGEIILDAQTLAASRTDHADLRVYDASRREVPYALRVLRRSYTSDAFEATEFNRGERGDEALLSLDLGQDRSTHNEIEIDTSGANFRRRVRVEAGDDGLEWTTLVNDAHIFRFRSGASAVDERRVMYPESRYRYLRVSVQADRPAETAPPTISSVIVRRTIQAEGREETFPLIGPAREPVREQGRAASLYRISAAGRLPLQGLHLSLSESEFSRPYRLERTGEQGRRLPVSSGRLTPDENGGGAVLRFDECFAHELLLTITDDRNPPLQIYSVIALSAGRQLLIKLAGSEPPLRLYYGNESAAAPHYDFAQSLPATLENPPLPLYAGVQTANPDYRAPQPPLTERAPWAVYLVLGLASLALFVMLRGLIAQATPSE